MLNMKRTMTGLLVLVLAIPGLAVASSEGRLIGKVVDEQGNPVEGVVVTATAPSIPSFSAEDTTDKRGVFKMDFPQLDVAYHFRFEKAGFAAMDTEINWERVGTARQEFTLHPGGMVEAGAAPVASTSNAAITAYNAGLLALRSQDDATAVAKFKEAVEHDPKLKQAWAALTVAYFEQNQYQEAVSAAETAINLGSSNEAMLRARWDAYKALGDDAKAEAALQDLKQSSERTAQAKEIYNQAVALFKKGDKEGALKSFQDAADLDPSLQVAQEGVATTAMELGENAQAAKAAEAILETDPSNEQALRIRYNAYLALGDSDKLVDALVGLAAINPDVARQGLLKLAYDAYDANDMAKAHERFSKIVELFPDQAQPYYVLALIEVNNGDKEQAMKHLEQFLQKAPNDPEADTAKQLLDYLKKQQ